MTITEIPNRVIERVHAHVAMGRGGCHISTYSVASHGYAQVGWVDAGVRKMALVHRVVWIATYGPIESGMTVDHLCRTRRCMRMLHLRVIPNLENARRTSGRDWPLGQCVNGHIDAIHWRPASATRKKGYCVACDRESQIRYELADPERARERRRLSQIRRRAAAKAAS